MAPLVYVAEDGQLVYRGQGGDDWRRLTHPLEGASGLGWQLHRRGGGWGWPCPSPDGRTIAAFHYPSAPDQAAELRLVDLDGVAEKVLLSFEGALPVYCQWSADSQMLGALAQEGEGLQLQGCQVGTLGRALEIEQGAPLFFQWMDQDGRVLVHVGDGSGDARVLVRCLGSGEDLVLGKSKGVFSAPQLQQGRIWLSMPSDRQTKVVCVDPVTGEIEQRLALEGWSQLIPSRTGQWMALIGLDPASRREGLGLLDRDEGHLRRLRTGPVLAVEWLSERALVVAVESPSGTSLTWTLVDTETEEMISLADFWPTPEEAMRLRFSSQFLTSHPRVDLQGMSLVYASYANPEAKGSEPGVSFIHQLDLGNPTEPPELLDKGSLAVYLPNVLRTGVENADA